MNLTPHISNLITAFSEMRKAPGTNKKAINKTIARLEEAELWSRQIVTPELAANLNSLDATAPLNPGVCICPPGVRDKNCPVHGKGA